MKFINHRTIYSSLFYVLVILLFVVWKPTFMFDKDGRIKPFGVGDSKTIFSLGVVVAALAIISYYIFAMIDVLFD